MSIYLRQRTISRPATCSGIGVHSGREVSLTIKPAPVNHGIKFIRTDLPGRPEIAAHFNKVVDTSLATVIGYDGVIISTIEHIMATFSAFSIDNAHVEVNDYELPIMDGSAAPFVSMIRQAGVIEQEAPRYFFIVKKTIALHQGDRSVVIYPSPIYKITCNIDFKHPLINQQSLTIDVTEKTFENEIAGARTFGFLHELEYLKKYGFARGGALDNAIVIDKHNILNPDGLRFPDEFVRHKILDCIGDFSLLGMPILGHVVATRSGHFFNHEFLKQFFNQKGSWETSCLHKLSEPGSCATKHLAI
ncbi:MAG: UDP-3-O-acyl-N-acetylglucosamine deacetylase [Desulfobacterales bacterium]|nr:UDP-3-O-acyl-N-acetylglucosamine deacetylase [Desulfobacterales bacterium]MDD4070931.1 UDP-3-O-acyl-N-acetylglucosamine deacetylase [Desulfobacterales bacterium]MDD4393443.1 UDP-3-O-acyl-N-acetylglucosamine deacetylase [Desulfobacterales bacterium]